MAGRIGGVVPPPMPMLLAGKSVHDIFSESSGGDIDLTMDTTRLAADLAPEKRVVTSLDLHESLARLTENSSVASPLNRIGLIYAGGYDRHPEVLGLMFDRGFTTKDDPNVQFQAVPREGCAVFLDSIATFRGADASLIEQEVRFTTVHELGHVFNLEHVDGQNFLACSDAAAVFGAEHYKFCDQHRALLALCSKEKCVQPGGTKYGDRADLGSSFDPNANNAPAHGQGRTPLKMHVQLTHESFWFCEPVEIEIRITSPRNAGEHSIPDAVDPGRAEFAIWIEEPNGGRRAYESPKFFCARTQSRAISFRNPFARDLSIFGQAGGYTFRQAGIHRLWATLRLSPRVTLRSNVVECELREPTFKSRQFARLHPLLTKAGKLLYYRSSADPDSLRATVERISEIARGTATAAAAHYALGRAFGQKAARDASRATGHARKALLHLRRARGNRCLGDHSACRAEECIHELEMISAGKRSK